MKNTHSAKCGEKPLEVGRWIFRLAIFFSAAFIAAFFIFISTANAQTYVYTVRAQEADQQTMSANAEPAVISEEEQRQGQEGEELREELPPELELDLTVTRDDLDAVDPVIGISSPFHFVKRIGWGMQEAFTFDPVEKADLKLDHASQLLYEMKAEIDNEGVEDMNPDLIANSMERIADKFGDVGDIAEDLKEESVDNPEAVDEIMNKVLDRQIKQKKVIDRVVAEASEHLKDQEDTKEKTEEMEGLVEDYEAEEIDESQDKKLEDLIMAAEEVTAVTTEAVGNVLVIVEEDAESIADRITEVLDEQVGSQFKHFRHIELLEDMSDLVPESAKAAIENAKLKTQTAFEKMLEKLPAGVRAERFATYVEHTPGNELNHISFLDDLKQGDIPADILESIEKIKEFAIGKFEHKVDTFNKRDDDLRDLMFNRFDGDDVGDLLMMREISDRTDFFDDNMDMMMMEFGDRSIQNFAHKFAEAESIEQVDDYKYLQKILLERPGDPKAHRLLNDIEQRLDNRQFVREFEKIGDQMASKLEAQFRREGDFALDRYVTLDPRDMEFFMELEGQGRFDSDITDRILGKQAEVFKEFTRDINVNNHDHFDRVMDRFHHVDNNVIDNIRRFEPEFDDALQHKRRRIEEARLQLEENEIFHEMDRMRRQAEDDFWDVYNNSDTNKRVDLIDNRYDGEMDLLESELNERMRISKERFANDPFCDAVCQQVQLSFLEQEYDHRQLDAKDEYRRRVKDEERMRQEEQMRQEEDEWYRQQEEERMRRDEEDRRRREQEMNNCGEGQYYDFGRGGCVFDPYWVPPQTFTDCPYGQKWNERYSHCEYEETEISPVIVDPGFWAIDCARGFYLDFQKGECVRDPNWVDPEETVYCGPGFYYDHFMQRCEQDYYQSCAPWQFWDFERNTCVDDASLIDRPRDCPFGMFWDFNDRECRESNDPRPWERCGDEEYWNPDVQECHGIDDTPEPPQPEICPSHFDPVCDTQARTHTNECVARASGATVAYYGECNQRKSCNDHDEYWDENSQTCRLSWKDCGYNMMWDSFNQECRGDCTGGQEWDSVGKYCKTIDYGEDGGCGKGWYWDGAAQSCLQDGVQCESYESKCGDCPINDMDDGQWCRFDSQGCPLYCMEDDVDDDSGHAGVGCGPGNWCAQGDWCADDNNGFCCPAYAEHICDDGRCVENYSECGDDDDEDDHTQCEVHSVDPCTGCTESKCVYDDEGCRSYCSEFDIEQEVHVDCPWGWHFDDRVNLCIRDGYNCNSPEACDSCSSNQECEYWSSGCPKGCVTSTGTSGGDCDVGYRWVAFPEKPTDGYCAPDNSSQNCTNNPYAVNGTSNCNYDVCEDGCEYEGACPARCIPHEHDDDHPTTNQPYTYAPEDCGGGWNWNSDTESCVRPGVNCSSYSSVCGACPQGDMNDSYWCEYDGDGCPMACREVGQCDNDGYCDPGESYEDCSSDCGTYSGGQCDHDGYCDTGETPSDCPDCSSYTSSCNNNGTCEDGETFEGCGSDCSGSCDNDGSCDPGEDMGNCGYDCGGSCDNDGTCESGEDSMNCGHDCDSMYGTGGSCDYNGVCESDENSSSCPEDCNVVDSGAAYDDVTLHGATITDSGLQISYSKNFSTCAHLLFSSFGMATSYNYYCTMGDSIVVTQPLDQFSVSAGDSIMLCHGNNYGVCSGTAAITDSRSSVSSSDDSDNTSQGESCGSTTCGLSTDWCADSSRSMCCPTGTSVLCDSGACTNSLSDCGDHYDDEYHDDDFDYYHDDGGAPCGTGNTCAQGDWCADVSNGWCCPAYAEHICDDGRCVENYSECDSQSYNDTGFWKRLGIKWDSFISKLLGVSRASRY